MTILAVCGFGVGSSLLLKISIDKAYKALGIDSEAINADLITAKSTKCDAIFTSVQMADDLRAEVNVPVYAVNRYMDVQEVTGVVTQFMEEHGFSA